MYCFVLHTSLPDNHRELEPPDPIPNSVVKWFIADGSVGFPHVRVGHCQASKLKTPSIERYWGFFLPGDNPGKPAIIGIPCNLLSQK